MTAPTYAAYATDLAALNILGWALETTPGTYVAPTITAPVTKLDFHNDSKQIESKTYQGDRVAVHATTPGVIDGKGSFTAEPNINEVGWYLAGILNVLAETGTGTITHMIGLASAYTPNSFSFTNAQGPVVKQYAGAYLSEVTLSLDGAEKLLTVDVKVESLPGYVSSAYTPSWDTSAKIPFWGNTLKIGNSSTSNETVYVKKAKWSIKRTTKPEHPGTGSQVAAGQFSGLVSVDFEATITVNGSDVTELTVFESGLGTPRYVANNMLPADATGHSLLIEALTLKYDSVVLKQDNLDGTVDLELKGKCQGASTTLAGATGYNSPIQATLVNGVAAGTYGTAV